MYISKKVALVTPLVFLAAFFVFVLLNGQRRLVNTSVSSPLYMEQGSLPSMGMADSIATSKMAIPPIYPAPDAVVGGQMYLQDTSLSLVSGDPVSSEQAVRQITTELGGFLVNSQVSRPEEGSTATVVVRVPTGRLDDALRRFEGTSERVVSKSIQGRDVTEQYQDLESRLVTLTTVQERLQALLAQTNDASTLLQIQQQLFQVQDQMDSIEGQRRYLEGAVELTRVTIYLASDEQALPYVPAEPWKPEAIFKQAVRSLVGSLRGVGTAAIWGAVYLPILLPIGVFAWWLSRRSKRPPQA